jgi:hypothetical protein
VEFQIVGHAALRGSQQPGNGFGKDVANQIGNEGAFALARDDQAVGLKLA